MFSFRELLCNFDLNVMLVHLIKKQTLENYAKLNNRSAIPIEDWLQKLGNADWNNPGDIKKTFNAADLLGHSSNKVIFDLGGNNYRMICKYAFGKKQVHLFICWIGTHAEYNIVCKNLKQYTVNIY